MYSGTGSFSPRASTWQYLQQPIPVLLLIHFVSNSRQIAQNTVGPVHFNQVLMDNGCWHTLIKMLDLTALLTKDRIEPLALPELFAGEAKGLWQTLLPTCTCAWNDTFLSAVQRCLRAVKEMEVPVVNGVMAATGSLAWHSKQARLPSVLFEKRSDSERSHVLFARGVCLKLVLLASTLRVVDLEPQRRGHEPNKLYRVHSLAAPDSVIYG